MSRYCMLHCISYPLHGYQTFLSGCRNIVQGFSSRLKTEHDTNEIISKSLAVEFYLVMLNFEFNSNKKNDGNEVICVSELDFILVSVHSFRMSKVLLNCKFITMS